MDLEFEWDEGKRLENIKKHKIDFEEAIEIFFGPTVTKLDTRQDYGEDRYISMGQIDGFVVLVVVYVDKKTNIRRIISARRATKNEQKVYYKRIFRG
ncbi:BrnT family toxin [Desulfobacter curvatus]|uniref:BrnT family toxin n=1 Tax=Desulfobacter curvatus TaxID=2290 RepID=UPI0003662CD9|nr:BrnT family toxin [Desulfobacter curvatus]